MPRLPPPQFPAVRFSPSSAIPLLAAVTKSALDGAEPKGWAPVAVLTVDEAAQLGKGWPLTSFFLHFTPHRARLRESLEDRDWTSGWLPPCLGSH